MGSWSNAGGGEQRLWGALSAERPCRALGRVMQPPAVGAAEAAHALRFLVKNHQRDHRPAGRGGMSKGGIVVQPQIVAKPYDDGAVVAICRVCHDVPLLPSSDGAGNCLPGTRLRDMCDDTPE